MAVIEQSGLMKYKDADGNVYLLYPITNKDNVDGLEEFDAHLLDKNNPHGVTWEQLPDKPFGYYEEQELLASMELVFENQFLELPSGFLTLVERSTYTINWDGVEYSRVAATVDVQGIACVYCGNMLFFGDFAGSTFEDSGEPFLLISFNGTTLLFAQDTNNHTVGIAAPAPVIVPDEFLPVAVGERNSVEGEIFNCYDGSNVADGFRSHAEGSASHADGNYSHAEGSASHAEGECSHAEGWFSHAEGNCSHAEGSNSHAEGKYSHAEGECSHAEGECSHAEGLGYKLGVRTITGLANATTYTIDSVTELIVGASVRYDNRVNGTVAFNTAKIIDIDADNLTITLERTLSADSDLNEQCVSVYVAGLALGDTAHSEGYRTIAAGRSQHTQGEYNIVDPEYDATDNSIRGKYAHIVGNGTSHTDRSNAHTLDWEGNAWFQGDVYVGGTSQDDAIKLSKEGHTHDEYAEVEHIHSWDKVGVTGSDTLTWDGNTEGLENVNGGIYKVSAVILSEDNVASAILNSIIDGDIPAGDTEYQFMDGIGMVARSFSGGKVIQVFSIPTDNLDLYGDGSLIFPSAGLWTNVGFSLTIPGYTGFLTPAQLPEERLPEHSHGWDDVEKTVTYGDTLTWDGNTEGRMAVDPFYKVSDIVLESDDIVSGATVNGISNGVSASTDAVVYTAECTGCYVISYSIVVVYEEGATMRELTFDCEFAEKGIYFCKNGTSCITSLTIPGYTGFETLAITPMPEEYLPESVTTHIADTNNPHNTKWEHLGESPTGSDTLTWDGNTEGLTPVSEMWYHVSDSVPVIDDFTNGCTVKMSDGGSLELTSDTLLSMDGIIANDAYSFFVIPESGVGVDIEGMVFDKPGVWLMNDTGFYVTSLTIPGYTGFPSVNKVPEKYLPETVATVDYVNDAIQSAINAAMEASY